MLIFQLLVPVLTPDAVPGDEGPSLLELDLFSLMVSNVHYQLEYCPFTITESLLSPPEWPMGCHLGIACSLKYWREKFVCHVIGLCIELLLCCVFDGWSKNFSVWFVYCKACFLFMVTYCRTVDSYFTAYRIPFFTIKIWTSPFRATNFYNFTFLVCQIWLSSTCPLKSLKTFYLNATIKYQIYFSSLLVISVVSR